MSKLPRILSRRSAACGGSGSAAVDTATAATLMATRDDLAFRRDRTTARLLTARDAADQATARVRELMTAPEVDEVELARAERTRNECNGSMAGTEDALAELVERALQAEEARLERERQAGERASAVSALAGSAVAMIEAVKALGEAFDQFRVAAHAALPTSPDQPFGAGPMIGTVRGHILHDVFPDTYPRPIANIATGTVATGTAVEIFSIIEGLRREIEGVRTGTVVQLNPAPVYVPPPVFPDVPIALLRPAYFLTSLGQRVDMPQPGGIVVPEPIAAEAIRQGVAFGIETSEGKQIIAAVRDQPGSPIARGEDGRFYAKRFTGILGEDGKGRGKGLPAALPPANLGMLPATVDLAEAAE